jgi:hypothetical protein
MPYTLPEVFNQVKIFPNLIVYPQTKLWGKNGDIEVEVNE